MAKFLVLLLCRYSISWYIWAMPSSVSGDPNITSFSFRLRDIRDRKNPDAGPAPPGNLRSTSPISWANSVPGKSMSLVILLTTNSVNTSGFSCRSFSTKKSGLKITGWLRREESLQITKLQMASLDKATEGPWTDPLLYSRSSWLSSWCLGPRMLIKLFDKLFF